MKLKERVNRSDQPPNGRAIAKKGTAARWK
jgi:hypothetical protein